MAIVYCATNKISGKKYVGITKGSLANRKKTHRSCFKNGKKSVFYDALRSYGENNFEWEILVENNDISFISNEEKRLIKELKTQVPYGYNILEGGLIPPNMKGIPKSEEHKRKIGDSQKGKIIKPETIEKLKLRGVLFGSKPAWNKGLTKEDPRVLENSRRSAESKKGKKYPKISEAKKGKPAWNKGIPRTDEEKKRIKEGIAAKPKRTRIVSEITKRKISETRKGKKYPRV